ncbi:TRAP transporter small permease [Enterovirga sp.]|jgi:TRAP-type C4-dicarboxylate transport system permease small subunit|uniref:TRAP transporter small permease n=1 Tax=Enterovirga sp. TaxID=2026350 RepID=UPI00260BB0C3|nr:TRAP transporter small permease [Enterovirga sp.]MDB5591923.1 C4-dicarboxylate transporter permease [Enterovirga sp.]
MRILDRFYSLGIVLAAVFMVLIAALTLSQVVGRMIGVVIPDAGDLAGYAMAAATFLALAHTFRSGGHIRVNLLLIHVSRRLRHALECWCLAFLTVVGGLFAAFSIKLVMDSYAFGDVSTGMMPVPLWIPQISMALGAVLFEIAVIEELVRVIRGEEPRYERADGDAFTE